MKLYDAGTAPNPRRVRIFLAEKGIAVPLEQVDLGKLEHREAGFATLNPFQRVPALVLDDGTVIAESIAICRYFEEIEPEPPLFGEGAVERAMVEMWQRRIEFGLLGSIAAVFRHSHPFMKDMEVPQIPAWSDANRPRVIEFLTLLDTHLTDREFVCDAFSVADITGLVGIDFMRPSRIAVPTELVHVRRWHAAVAARPSASA